jgi:hypothetical protein
MKCFSKKGTIILISLIVVLGLGLGLGLLFGLRSTNRKIAVSQITSAPAVVPKASSALKSALIPVSSLTASTNSYAFAQVEGLKFTIIKFVISHSITGLSQTMDYAYEQVTMGNDGEAIKFEKNVPISEGSYNRIEAQMKNTYSVKGYCKTNNSIVYTSASGIKTIPLSSFAGSLPNYDYYEYPFASAVTAQSPTDSFQNIFPYTLSTSYNFNIPYNPNTTLAILFDTSYSVTCYDGVSTNGKINPFNWGTKTNAGKDLTDFFPTNKPNFGLHNLPLFGYVGFDYKDVTSQTYGISSTASAFSPILDTDKFVIVTMAFNADGSFLSASVRNEDVAHSTSLGTNWKLKSSSGNSFDFNTGAYYTTGQVDVVNRVVSGFTKTTDLSIVRTFNITDGPDCGKQLLENNQNRAISCSNIPLTSYWKRLA